MKDSLIILGWALLFVVLAIAIADSTTTKKTHGDSIGVLMTQNNPMTYKAGRILTVSYVNHGKGLVVEMQPIGTYGLYTEDFLFCDAPVEKFLNKTNPMVLTFRTKADRMVEGIGCHELLSADSLKPKEALQ